MDIAKTFAGAESLATRFFPRGGMDFIGARRLNRCLVALRHLATGGVRIILVGRSSSAIVTLGDTLGTAAATLVAISGLLVAVGPAFVANRRRLADAIARLALS